MRYYCIEKDCNKIVCGPNRRCRSCANKGKRNPIYGRKKDLKGEKNPNFKYKISKEFLIDKYVNKRKTILQITKVIGCSFSCIRQKMINYNIQRRNDRPTNPTKYENLFAKKLNQLNIKYDRQYKIKPYCCDFYLLFFNLIIEIDGYEKKQERKDYIRNKGYKLIHIKNNKVKNMKKKDILCPLNSKI